MQGYVRFNGIGESWISIVTELTVCRYSAYSLLLQCIQFVVTVLTVGLLQCKQFTVTVITVCCNSALQLVVTIHTFCC